MFTIGGDYRIGTTQCDQLRGRIKDNYKDYEWDLNLMAEYYRFACKCRSPVEAILFWAFVDIWKASPTNPLEGRQEVLFLEVPIENAIDILGLAIQHEVNIDGHKYFLDFSLQCWDGDKKESVNVAIEVDGHDFHEKTKEQARRDKFRDRMLQKAGYRVLRYTGSEVWKDSNAVVREIAEVITGVQKT